MYKCFVLCQYLSYTPKINDSINPVQVLKKYLLHDINLAARYSDRLALLKQGKLYTVGCPIDVLNPDILRDVFDIEVAVIETPVGLQICPLASR